LRAWASRYLRWLSFGLRISAGNWSANIQTACWARFPSGDALGTTMMVLVAIARISLLAMPDTNSLLGSPWGYRWDGEPGRQRSLATGAGGRACAVRTATLLRGLRPRGYGRLTMPRSAWAVLVLIASACSRMNLSNRTQSGPPSSPGSPSSLHMHRAAASEVLAALERTECEGYCPVYAVTIYRDGRVIFVGERFVRHQGELAFHVTSRTLQEVTAAFETARFQRFREAYNREDATD
jgi:hypothetical protein